MKFILKSMILLSLTVFFGAYGVQFAMALAPMGEQAVPTPAPTPAPMMTPASGTDGSSTDGTGASDGIGTGDSNGDEFLTTPMTPSPSPASDVQYSLSQYSPSDQTPGPNMTPAPVPTPKHTPTIKRYRRPRHTPRPMHDGKMMPTPTPTATPMGTDEFSPLSLLIQKSNTQQAQPGEPEQGEQNQSGESETGPGEPEIVPPGNEESIPDTIPHGSPTPPPGSFGGAGDGTAPKTYGEGTTNEQGKVINNQNGDIYGGEMMPTIEPMMSPSPTPSSTMGIGY